jgi:hypothetical protein
VLEEGVVKLRTVESISTVIGPSLGDPPTGVPFGAVIDPGIPNWRAECTHADDAQGGTIDIGRLVRV